MHSSDFPENFIWGVASSAYQTEGFAGLDGKGKSIWDQFSNKKGKVKFNQNADQANEFYIRYPEDIRLLREMNCRHFRFSIAWTRIFPDGKGRVNNKGIEFYNKLIDECLQNGIQPWITLYHWDLPLELQKGGGWMNRDIVEWFTEYVEVCIKAFGDRVKHWMVLNEPTAYTGLGYFMGIHAPGVKGLKSFLPAVHHSALANAIGGKMIRELDPDAYIGTTFSFSPIESIDQKSKNIAARNRVDALLNRLFLEPLLGYGYPLETLPSFKPIESSFLEGDEENLSFDFDFIGVQNYSREVVKFSYFTPYVNAKLVSAKKRKLKQTAMGWENYPDSILSIVKQLNTYKNIPDLIITESGIPLEEELKEDVRVMDKERVEYYQKYLFNLLSLTKEYDKLKGFFAWTNTDNFEWAEGYRPKFGLISINRQNQKRIPKDSFYWFQKFLKET